VLDYDYDSGLDDDVSRLTSISDGETILEAYTYLGLGTVVVRSHPEPDVDLSYVQVSGDTSYSSDGGDQYRGFDRFGRVIDQFWVDTNDDAVDRYQYTYDRDSNRTAKDNLLESDFDETYTYDNLNRLTDFDRADGFDQSWDQDAQGNFDEVDTDGTPVSRTHNAQNELTVLGGNNLTYDANGNLTTDENGNILIYDAWNRLVEFQDDEETTLVRYERDALGRVVERTADAVTTDVLYSVGWQVLEEQVDGETAIQNVWSPVYIDALILRDRDTNEDGDVDERLYAIQDANWNVTGVVTDAGAVAERMAYTAYGEVTFLEDDWDVKGSSDYDVRDLYQGRLLDDVASHYDFRRRIYDAELARFYQADPSRFNAGDSNLYRFVFNRPTSTNDPSGLQVIETMPNPEAPSRGALLVGTYKHLIPRCQIAIHCRTVASFTHCGLSILEDGTSLTQLDGGGPNNRSEAVLNVPFDNIGTQLTLIVRSGKQLWPEGDTGQKTQPFKGYPLETCKCLKNYVNSFNAANIPYNPLEGNSNWALGCMASKCKVSLDWTFRGGPPTAFDVPPRKFEIVVNSGARAPIKRCVGTYDCP